MKLKSIWSTYTSFGLVWFVAHENLWLDPKFNVFIMYTLPSMAFCTLADTPRRPYWIRYDASISAPKEWSHIFFYLENLGIDTIFIALACSLPPILGKKEYLAMAALINILLEMLEGDAMSSTGFSIRTTWATRISKEKNFISRIQVQPHGTRTMMSYSRKVVRFSSCKREWGTFDQGWIMNTCTPRVQCTLCIDFLN